MQYKARMSFIIPNKIGYVDIAMLMRLFKKISQKVVPHFIRQEFPQWGIKVKFFIF